jgi:hypothetical protein
MAATAAQAFSLTPTSPTCACMAPTISKTAPLAIKLTFQVFYTMLDFVDGISDIQSGEMFMIATNFTIQWMIILK